MQQVFPKLDASIIICAYTFVCLGVLVITFDILGEEKPGYGGLIFYLGMLIANQVVNYISSEAEALNFLALLLQGNFWGSFMATYLILFTGSNFPEVKQKKPYKLALAWFLFLILVASGVGAFGRIDLGALDNIVVFGRVASLIILVVVLLADREDENLGFGLLPIYLFSIPSVFFFHLYNFNQTWGLIVARPELVTSIAIARNFSMTLLWDSSVLFLFLFLLANLFTRRK